MDRAYPDRAARIAISVSIMLATIMVAIDGTIANVALPHMQSSVLASQEQIVWVLTSFLIASAVATPMAGWLADRVGRKRILLFSVVCFTVASIFCGLATHLGELVLFRILQGISGAAVVPLSQAILLDINPPERHGPAMAMYGMGSMLGPIMGPTLGGWLTDAQSWRWVFFINVPIGILAFLGISAFMTEQRSERPARFDAMGFGALAIFLACLQLVLDRGQQLDWLSSWEIRIELLAAITFLYVLVVHTLTTPAPFVRPAIFRDKNFLFGSLVSLQLGVIIYGIGALLAPMLQNLMGYPVLLAGLVTSPRGIGSAVAMLIVGRIIGKVDARVLVVTGLALASFSMYQMSHIALNMDSTLVVIAGLIQGMGAGMIFVPLSTMVFATLQPRYRNEGAAMFALTRSMGSAIGIAVLQAVTIRNTSTVHARLMEGVRPDNPALKFRSPDMDLGAPASLAGLQHEVDRQSSMVAYADTYWLLLVATIIMMLATLPMRSPKRIVNKEQLQTTVD
jgi:MFS transporter, DHA2 family, multidrug resistance protein